MNRYNYGTYLVTIQSFTVSEMDSIQLCSQSQDHPVLITGYFQVKTNNGTILTYLEIQNSWGTSSQSTYNGFQYIVVCVGNKCLQ